jgi:hypothetical protein
MTDRDISEAELDDAVAAAFGQARPGSAAMFREAGFNEEQAHLGAKLMESGAYFGFEDVATSLMSGGPFAGGLGPDNRPIAPGVTAARVAEVARQHAAQTGQTQRLVERRTATQVQSRILESGRASASGDSLLEAVLIDAGRGSSGHYPATTLQEAASRRVFHKGLHCYVDHPSASEETDRPERSVKDLAGCLETDAVFRDNGLHAKLRVYSSHREFISERASQIGLSIRGDGEISERGSDGAPVFSRITKAYSVDFVTQAGRGGRLVV